MDSIDPTSLAIGLGIGFAVAFVLLPGASASNQPINASIQKDSPKVATMCTVQDIEDLVGASDKGVKAYCRCWKSKDFPYCDGAHVKHNKDCRDNVGPLVVKKK